MTKTELLKEMAKDLNSAKEAQAALESLLSTITNVLKNGDTVTLTGFGTFKVSERKARVGRNPQTGKEIIIKPKNVAKFVPGKFLKDAIQE
ncbi:MAG: HU family DNA-binding protein [Proteobacteria bacterium]|nr:HU family DNA-binding protein [Pseudomonadota bacterium]